MRISDWSSDVCSSDLSVSLDDYGKRPSYSELMEGANSYLTVTLDLSDPVEIGDFAALFSGMGAQFERYLAEQHPDLKGQAHMFVKEVRKDRKSTRLNSSH